MMIDSIPANLATPSATVAQPIAILATDGAQIHTDGEAGEVAAFAAVFEKLSQPIPTEGTPAQPIPPDALILPNFPNVSPPPMDVEIEHALPCLIDLPVEEPVAEIEAEDVDVEEKPQKSPAAAGDCPNLPPPLPSQPIEISKSAPEEKTRLNGREKTLSGSIESLEPEKEQKWVESEAGPVQFSQEVTEELPVSVKDDAFAPKRSKIEPPRTEFTLSQSHIPQKEINPPAPTPAPLPEQSFIQTNHPRIITAIHGELLPNGGSMHIRLDPPELGALAVQIDVRDGIVTASFQTSNDEATRLLSHSLTHLRTTLESAGVSVEKLQVQQAPREQFNSASQERDQRERGPQQQAYERSAHDDQQRREMLQRMWRRLMVGRDVLDLVA